MSTAKYAGLPDIDTAQDVYETPDTFTSSQQDQGNSSDEDPAALQRGSGFRARDAAGEPGVASNEDLDSSPLMRPDAATKKFRKAEKRHENWQRLMYADPPTSNDDSLPARPPPLSQRLRALQQEVSSVEAELSDPSNPLLHVDGEIADLGVLMKGLVDVKGRLAKVDKSNDGRTRLLDRVLKEDESQRIDDSAGDVNAKVSEPLDIVELDRRIGELERLVGSAGTTLDESSPLSAPLLQVITRLGNQLTLLTQPRHIDSISRRLKLLLSDLDRVSASQGGTSQGGRRQSQPSHTTPVASTIQESLQPVLTRLTPILPHIPHILARLRTLSALHANASAFQDSLERVENEQKRVRAALEELDSAISKVEKGIEDNARVTALNVSGLETRVEELVKKIDNIGH